MLGLFIESQDNLNVGKRLQKRLTFGFYPIMLGGGLHEAIYRLNQDAKDSE